jgi:hypothetical protein
LASGFQIYPYFASGFQISPDFASGFQISPDFASGFQMSPDFASGFQMSLDFANGFQISPDFASGFQISPDFASGFQISPGFSSGFQISAASGFQTSSGFQVALKLNFWVEFHFCTQFLHYLGTKSSRMMKQTCTLPSENGLRMSTRRCCVTFQQRVFFIVTAVKTSGLTETQMTPAFLRRLTVTKVCNCMYPAVHVSSFSNNSFPTAHKSRSVSFTKSNRIMLCREKY